MVVDTEIEDCVPKREGNLLLQSRVDAKTKVPRLGINHLWL